MAAAMKKGVKAIKVLLISFSGRKSIGNCEASLMYVLELLQARGVTGTFLSMRDLVIDPCTDCNYECFEQELACPKEDDVRMVYEKILQSDIVIMAIPTYSAAPPSTYFAWRERSQGIFVDNSTWESYQKVIKGYIVFGNEEAGAKEVVHILSKESPDTSEVLLIQSHEYGQSSVVGRLLEFSEVRREIFNFIEELLRKTEGCC